MKSGIFWASLLLFLVLGCFASASSVEDANYGTLIGQLQNGHGTPMAVGVVSFFNIDKGLPLDGKIVRRIPDTVVRVGEHGRFEVKLQAGAYYIGALQRVKGKGPGPPRAGEDFFFALNDAGELKIFMVKVGKTVNVGRVSGVVPDISLEAGNYFVAAGTARYEDGRPFVNALVTVKEDKFSPRPLFISSPTDTNGKYSIKLPANETFYFMALETLRGGRPLAGSYIGSYGGSSPVPIPNKNNANFQVAAGRRDVKMAGDVITGKAGEIMKGLDITMYPMLDPEQVRSKLLKQVGAQSPADQKSTSDVKTNQ